jgi:serine/threonine-protein kinase
VGEDGGLGLMGASAVSAENDPKPKSDIDAGLLAGQLIGGQYRVGHLLGEGGMAVVWAGTNERTGKRVALKVIRPDVMSMPDAAALLRSEGMAASRINHPNVVTVFDVIEHAGMACIVMELLHGLPLGTYIFRSGRLSLRETTNILLPAMRGVAAAHAQGVIHRDLKPQNVFLCIDPDGRMVGTKVLDFGISFMMDWAKVHATDTTPGLLGTPAYIAPEIIEGAKRIDERVDVYGFGLLFYEALTGRVPYPGEAPTEVLHKVASEALVPMQELRPDLPAGMVSIVKTATAKRPEKRFVSLNQMASEIEDVLMQPTAHATSPTPDVDLPGSALSYTLAGPLSLAVPTHIGREPSGKYQQTLLLGSQPQKRPSEEARPDPELAEAAPKPAVASESPSAPPGPAGPEGGAPPAAVWARAARAALRIVRSHPVLAASGGALAVAIVTWLAISAGGGAKAGARVPQAQAPLPTAVPAALSPAEAPLPPPVAPAATATVPAADTHDRAAEQAPSDPRARSGRERAARKKARVRLQPQKPPPPRAGKLRLGDF